MSQFLRAGYISHNVDHPQRMPRTPNLRDNTAYTFGPETTRIESTWQFIVILLRGLINQFRPQEKRLRGPRLLVHQHEMACPSPEGVLVG